MRLPPIAIEAILHIYYTPEPHPNRQSPAMQTAYREFLEGGLVVPDGQGHFTCTPKGQAWVEMICRTPFPVEQVVWFDPRTSQPVEGLIS